MLRQRGHKGSLVLGVRREEGVFLSHAWVEHQGCPVNDRADISEDFRVIDRI